MTSATSWSAIPRRPRPAAFLCETARGAPSHKAFHRLRRRFPIRRAGGVLALGAACVLGSPGAFAQGRGQVAAGSPRAACLEAARQSEITHNLPRGIMVGIALAESGLHAYAMNIAGRAHFPASIKDARRLYNGARGRSVMAGCVQINTRAHARNGSDWPLDPVRATDWAANHLRVMYERTGDWGDAIRRWNGGAPGTANRLVCKVQAKILAENPNSRVLSGERCNTTYAWDRRNGRANLEIAEAAAER